MSTVPDHTRPCLGLLMVLPLALAAGAFSQPVESPAQDSGAKEKALVLVVSMEACSERALAAAEAKTADEFKALGFSIDVVDCEALSKAEGTLDVFRALEAMAEERDAVCAISILQSVEDMAVGVDIWIADLVTKKTTYKHWAQTWEDEAVAAQIVALKTVEMLEVSFLELAKPESIESHAPPPEPVARMVETAKAEFQPLAPQKPQEPPEPLEAGIESSVPQAKKPTGYLGLRFGAGVFGSTMGMGAMAGLQVAIRWNAMAFMALEAEGLIPPTGKDSDTSGLSITFNTAAVRLWLLFAPVRVKWFRLELGPGGGVLIAWARAISPMFEGIRSDRTQTGYAGGSLQAAFVILKNLWIRLGFSAGTSLPRISITYNDQQVVAFGMPLLEGFLGLELRLP